MIVCPSALILGVILMDSPGPAGVRASLPIGYAIVFG
jgi:hypothetical protein